MEREATGAELGRQIWLQERRAGIGGSDAAAILGDYAKVTGKKSAA